MAKIGFICEQCKKYYRYSEVGDSCPRCEMSRSECDVQANVFQEGTIDVSPDKKLRIASRLDRKEAEKRYAVAPYEEVKDRAKDGIKNRHKQYCLSDSQKALNYRLKRDGVTSSLIDNHPKMSVFRRQRSK